MAASLKRELSFEQWRVFKRLLTDVAGRDIVGSENNLLSYLNENNNHEYEAGSFTSQLGNKVTLVRITDLKTVVQNTISSLSRVGEIQHVGNKPPETLQLFYCADKGLSQTKLLFSVLNSKLKHSINRAKLLTIFDGEKDTRECVEKVSYFTVVFGLVCHCKIPYESQKLLQICHFICHNFDSYHNSLFKSQTNFLSGTNILRNNSNCLFTLMLR